MSELERLAMAERCLRKILDVEADPYSGGYVDLSDGVVDTRTMFTADEIVYLRALIAGPPTTPDPSGEPTR